MSWHRPHCRDSPGRCCQARADTADKIAGRERVPGAGRVHWLGWQRRMVTPASPHAVGTELDDQLGPWQLTDQVGLRRIPEHDVWPEPGDQIAERRHTELPDRRGGGEVQAESHTPAG